MLHYLYQIIDQVKKVKDGNFEIQIAESSQDEIGERLEILIKCCGKYKRLSMKYTSRSWIKESGTGSASVKD